MGRNCQVHLLKNEVLGGGGAVQGHLLSPSLSASASSTELAPSRKQGIRKMEIRQGSNERQAVSQGGTNESQLSF